MIRTAQTTRVLPVLALAAVAVLCHTSQANAQGFYPMPGPPSFGPPSFGPGPGNMLPVYPQPGLGMPQPYPTPPSYPGAKQGATHILPGLVIRSQLNCVCPCDFRQSIPASLRRTRHSSWKQADRSAAVTSATPLISRSAMKASRFSPKTGRADSLGRTTSPVRSGWGNKGPETRGHPHSAGKQGATCRQTRGHPHSAGAGDQVAAELCVSLRFPAVDSCLAPSDPPQLLETGRSQRSGDLGHSPDFAIGNESESL